MKERRNIKIRTNMYEDTKFKIIDTMVERDTINYIWTRILTLCGKVNDSEGRLYVTPNMPYTIEILAIEFNRTLAQVENAINVFINLNMISKDSGGFLKVINWCKYQDSSRKNNNKKNDVNKIIGDEKDEYNQYEFKENLEEKSYKKIESIDSINEVKNVKNEAENRIDQNKMKIIDISNTDLVKDKIGLAETKKESNLSSKRKKTKVNKKKMLGKNNCIAIEEEERKNEIIEFTEPMPIPEDCEKVAFFDFS